MSLKKKKKLDPKLTVISFNLPTREAEHLKLKPDYTLWVKEVVLQAMGTCPVCKSHPKKQCA